MSIKNQINKSLTKRMTSLLLVFLFLFSSIVPSISAFAATVKGTIFVGYYTMQTPCTLGNLLVNNRVDSKTMRIDGVHKAAYCLENGKGTIGGNPYTEWTGLSPASRKLFSDILALGFQYSGSTYWASGTEEAYKWAVTQILVWYAERGTIYKDSTTGLIVVPSSIDSAMATVAPHSYHPDKFIAYYNTLKANLVNLYQIPSYAARTASKATEIKLTWDGSGYSATVPDTNNVTGRFDFKIDGCTITRSNGSITIKAPASLSTQSSIVSPAANYIPKNGLDAFIALKDDTGDNGIQAVGVNVGSVDGDPIPAYIRISFDAVGDTRLQKVSENGVVSGLKFEIAGGGQTVQKTTDSAGFIDVKGWPIKDNNGNKVSYTAKELNTPVEFVIPATQTFTLTDGQTTQLKFENVLKKWRITVTKKDSEKDAAQGDATLSGAVYGIYKNGTLLDSYTTNSAGTFTTNYYVCGNDYTLREITPSKGYQLDTTVHTVGVEAGSTTIERNDSTKSVPEQVIKGRVQIHKILQEEEQDSTSGLREPEVGAEFEIFLKSATSYSLAKESERDRMVTDNTGYVISKSLPYGEYQVRQIKGTAGYKFTSDFTVFISEHQKTYVYYIGNAGIYADVKIVKKDAETGGIIPLSGIGFKIKNLSTGEFITQTVKYPTPDSISEFYTDDSGMLMLPEKLKYGKYSLHEIQAPHGYVLSSDPVAFTIDGSQSTIEVIKENTAQKGTISVLKTGLVFSSVTETEGIFSPVFKEQGLKGTVYKIFAHEDIVTADKTVRYTKNELVDTITTGSNGKASSKQIYLGKYRIEEITASHGMVCNKEVKIVTLAYAGQDIAVINEDLSLYNERQKVSISGSKSVEIDSNYAIGSNGEIANVKFGLYANEILTAADGKVIPADGLVSTVQLPESGNILFDADLPFGKYYIKEIATDEHYTLSDETHPFEFKYEGQDSELVEIKINDGKEIENKLKRSKVSGKKLGEEGQWLEGVVFGIFPEDAPSFAAEESILTTVTEKEGVFIFDDVPFGKWIVAELETIQGFILSDEKFPIEITEHEQVVEIEAWNKYFRGRIEGLKLSEPANYQKEPAKTENNVKTSPSPTPTTSPSPMASSTTKPTPDSMQDETGNQIADTSIQIGIDPSAKPENTTSPTTPSPTATATPTPAPTTMPTAQPSATPSAETKPTSAPLRPYLAERGAPVMGVDFGLYPVGTTDFKTENALATTKTDADGKFAFDEVVYGDYLIKELQSPAGYVLSDEIYPVSIDGTDDVVYITVINEITKVHISKVDLTTEKELPGAQLEIKTQSGDVVHSWVSSDKPYVMEMLPVGNYTLTEKIPPEGYFTAENIPFEVKNSGEIVKIVMKDEKKPVPQKTPDKPKVPEKPETPTPKTSDDRTSPILLWILIGTGIIGLAASAYFLLFKKKKQVRWIVSVILSFLFILLLGIRLSAYYAEQKHQLSQFEELKDLHAPQVDTDTEHSPDSGDSISSSTATSASTSLRDMNSDYIGWIHIPDTALDYPLMQTKSDPEHYLKRDFHGNFSNYGVPFLDAWCDINSSSNLIAHAHHMDDGTMFAVLDEYKDPAFTEAHPKIFLEIDGAVSEYAVVASLLQRGSYSDDEESIYQTIDIDSPSVFDKFAAFIASQAAVRTDESIQFGDSFLTLSTCEYSRPDGRIVVLAKKV